MLLAMQNFPRSALEFEQWFATDADCVRYLASIRWPGGFRCPRCGNPDAWTTARGQFRCTWCDVQTSVTAGTIFQGTRKGLRLWLRAMWHLTEVSGGTSASEIQRVLGLSSYRTAWIWLHKLRRVMVRPVHDRLTGLVEVDEAFVKVYEDKRWHRGFRRGTLLIVGVADRGGRAGRIRLLRLADGSPQNILRAVREMAAPPAEIRADPWPAYAGLPLMGYQLRTIGPEPRVVGLRPLPMVASVMDELNRWVLGTLHGAIRPVHLDYYLAEFTFRFNHRLTRTPGKLFGTLVRRALETDRISGDDIVGSRSEEP